MEKEVSHYVVTAQPPGSVLATAKCNFLSPHSKVELVCLRTCCLLTCLLASSVGG